MAEPKVARVLSVSDVTPTVRTAHFLMKSPETLEYLPGKYVIVTTDRLKENGKPVKRAYSIASTTNDLKSFELCVKHMNDEWASDYIHKLNVDDELTFSGSWGKFLLPENLQTDQNFVYVATGTGISVAMAHLSYLENNPQWRGKVKVYWGLRKITDLFWKDELKSVKNRSQGRIETEVFFSEEAGGKPLSSSFTDGDIEFETESIYYLSGNGHMISKVEEAAKSAGISEEKIIKEIYFN